MMHSSWLRLWFPSLLANSLLILILSPFGVVHAGNSCNYSVSEEVDFIPGGEKEVIELKIQGESCKNAYLKTVVRDKESKIYYEHANKLRFFEKDSIKWGEGWEVDAKNLLGLYLKIFMSGNDEFDRYYSDIECGRRVVVTKTYFEKLKLMGVDFFTVPYLSNTYHVIGYVPELRQAILVGESGC